jgi:hypothetical protein
MSGGRSLVKLLSTHHRGTGAALMGERDGEHHFEVAMVTPRVAVQRLSVIASAVIRRETTLRSRRRWRR